MVGGTAEHRVVVTPLEIGEGDLVACCVEEGEVPVHAGRAGILQDEEPSAWQPGAGGEGLCPG